jgi:ribosomal protein S21
VAAEVRVREGEGIESIVRRFRMAVQQEYGRRWYKKRIGYYEKPSELRRKRKKMAKIQSQCGGTLWLRIGQEDLFRRTGPMNAAGR